MEFKFVSHKDEVLRAFHEQLELGMEAVGSEAVRYAVEDCPRDTGRLQNSIDHEVNTQNENAIYIGTNVEYAPYVEFNDNVTHESGKAHFLRDAATTHSEQYKRMIETALK